MSEPPKIIVVIPAFRVAKQIADLVARIPSEVAQIIVVNDASPDDLATVLAAIQDPRLLVLTHEVNQGVGAATKSGFAKALELKADVVVKLDGDGQMDPALISKFVDPIVQGRADFTKGNRFADLLYIRRMPIIRRIGNVALSFLVKMASGYWHLFDPCNGYIAIRADLLRLMSLRRLANRYFFEITMLCEAYFVRAVLQDIPMQPVYGDESSSLRPERIVVEFSPRLMARTLYRVMMSYFLRDFNVVTIFLLTGLPLFVFGVIWSLYYWVESVRLQILASTGTVMIGALSIILGFQLLLQATVLDVQNEPGRNRLS